MGLILSCYISAASIRDEWGAAWALDALNWRGSRLRLLWADAGYPGALASWAWRVLGCHVEIVHRPEGQKGFGVLKGRWVDRKDIRMVGTEPETLEGLRRKARVKSRDDSVFDDPPSAQKIASVAGLNTGSKTLP